jgi:hypothetical protein
MFLNDDELEIERNKRFQKVRKPNAYKMPQQRYEKKNTRINRFKHFTEIIYHNEPYDSVSGKKNYDWVDMETGEIVSHAKHSQLLDEMEIAQYKAQGEILEIDYSSNYARSEYESERRAKDNFYGFAFCNDWGYFCTFTIAVKKFESDDKATKYYWQIFRQKLQYKFPDIKILAVPERHEKCNIHFHALLGNADLDGILTTAINPHTKEPIFQNERQVFNLPLWDKGFSTVVKIDTANTDDQMKTSNYLAKYLTQNHDIGAWQKRYYHTKNLDFKDTETKMTYPHELAKLEKAVTDGKLVKHKQAETFTIFRVYNKPVI